MPLDVTFVTPTYKGDYERFCLLRESIERCNITIPHIAVVQHEDIALFRQVPHKTNLIVVSTREVLPSRIEGRRVAWNCRRRNPQRWIYGKPMHGWYSQQLVKLAVSSMVETAGLVCLDSDILFISQVQHKDFFTPEGKLHLYETVEDLDVEMAEWLVDSMKFLKIPLKQKLAKKYIHPLAPLHCEVLSEFKAYVEHLYSKPWAEAMAEKNVTEYMTYGSYASCMDQLKRQEPIQPALCYYFWWPEAIEALAENFFSVVQQHQAKAVLVQSNIGHLPSAYRILAEAAWTSQVTDAAVLE